MWSRETVNIKETKFFILFRLSWTPVNSLGATPIDFAYDSNMLSGFMAKAGKLIPINDLVVTNFLTTKPTIFEELFFHY
jgi:hypothetical protein